MIHRSYFNVSPLTVHRCRNSRPGQHGLLRQFSSEFSRNESCGEVKSADAEFYGPFRSNQRNRMEWIGISPISHYKECYYDESEGFPRSICHSGNMNTICTATQTSPETAGNRVTKHNVTDMSFDIIHSMRTSVPFSWLINRIHDVCDVMSTDHCRRYDCSKYLGLSIPVTNSEQWHETAEYCARTILIHKHDIGKYVFAIYSWEFN
jgi:hypothetical protein